MGMILVKVLAGPQETLGLGGDSWPINFTPAGDLFTMFSNLLEEIFAPK